MTKLTAILMALFCIAGIATGNGTTHDPKDLIEWNEFYKLRWEDFQGEASSKSFGDAGTAVYIKAKPFYVKKKIAYNVQAFFVKNESWTREKSEALLAHEQLHFDIAELYARKARKKIQELSNSGVNDIKVYNAAVQKILDESNDIDRHYDIETLHGALSDKQSAWLKKVNEELASLEKYKRSIPY